MAKPSYKRIFDMDCNVVQEEEQRQAIYRLVVCDAGEKTPAAWRCCIRMGCHLSRASALPWKFQPARDCVLIRGWRRSFFHVFLLSPYKITSPSSIAWWIAQSGLPRPSPHVDADNIPASIGCRPAEYLQVATAPESREGSRRLAGSRLSPTPLSSARGQ